MHEGGTQSLLSSLSLWRKKGKETKRKKKGENPKISKKSELQKSENEEQIPQPQLPQFDRISFQPSFPPDGDLEFAAHLEVLVRDFNFDLPLMGNDKDKKQGSKKGVTTTNIYLNIYDLTPFNNYLYWFGLGIFHSGIEVHGMEYGYGAHDYPTSGVFEVEPRVCPGFLFRQSVRLGTTNMPQSDFQNFIQDLASKYHGNSYHLISKNCNHFTEEIAMYLTGKPIPAWVNRLARLGSLFHCLLPDGIQVSQVRHIPSQNRNNSSEDGSDSTISSIIDDEDDLLLMAPRLSNFSSSCSTASTSNSNANSNSNSNASSNSDSDSNSNTISNSNTNSNSNSHSRSQSHSHSHSHSHSLSQAHALSHLRSHSSAVFNYRDREPPKLAKDLM